MDMKRGTQQRPAQRSAISDLGAIPEARRGSGVTRAMESREGSRTQQVARADQQRRKGSASMPAAAASLIEEGGHEGKGGPPLERSKPNRAARIGVAGALGTVQKRDEGGRNSAV